MATYETVLHDAMSLSPDEQALLVCELESGGREPGYDKDWDAEIKRRLDDIHSGRTKLLDDEEFDRLAWGDLDADADSR